MLAPLLALLATILPAGLVAAAEVPIPAAPQGRVNDYAGVLGSADRATLEAQLLRYEQAGRGVTDPANRGATGEQAGAPQIAVVTIPTLNGDAPEDVALRFAERWKIGSHADDGILLLVAVAERKVRIEVGYGAEGRLTDAMTSRIIREIIGPRLHLGDYPGGLRAGVAAIHQALTGQPVTGIDQQADGRTRPAYPSQGKRWGMGGGVLLLLFLIIVLGGRGRGGGGGGSFLTGMLLGSVLGGRRDGGFGGGGGDGGGFSGGGGGFGGGGATGDY